MKDIKNRIKSVEGTMQITKAMELVATSKLKKARERIEKTRPYFDFLKETIHDIENSSAGVNSDFYKDREINKTCIVVIAGDRGLAGGFNSNLFKKIIADCQDKDVCVVPIGKKAGEFFVKRGYDILFDSFNIAENVGIADCYDLGRFLSKAYKSKKFDRLVVYYTHFVSMMSQTPACDAVLPLEKSGDKKKNLTLYEPSPESALESIVPLYISGVLYGAMAESQVSEFGARRMAMDNATKNADEMIENLTLKYNRARQAAITQEITEIVSGAEAL